MAIKDILLKPTLGLIATLAFSSLSMAKTNALDEVIYGQDNRQEVSSVASDFIKSASLTVAGKVLFNNLQPSLTNSSHYDFPQQSLALNDQVCHDEPFAQQNVLFSCSAFLLGPDLLVTAGHCMENWIDCRTSAWVFDYTNEKTSLHKKDVYRCKKIIARELVKNRKLLADYAVIQLDRKVESHRKPLPYRKDSKRVKLGTPISVVGHPMGLPMKYADDAKVRGWNWLDLILPLRGIRHRKFYFTADLDTFAGNSGSPVLNMKAKQIEGILVEGAKDLKMRNDSEPCYISRTRPAASFFARETVFRINKIPGLNQMVEDSFARFE